MKADVAWQLVFYVKTEVKQVGGDEGHHSSYYARNGKVFVGIFSLK